MACIRAPLQPGGRGPLALEPELLSGMTVIDFIRGKWGTGMVTSELVGTRSCEVGPVLCPLKRGLH